jgi:hypothetical protein
MKCVAKKTNAGCISAGENLNQFSAINYITGLQLQFIGKTYYLQFELLSKTIFLSFLITHSDAKIRSKLICFSTKINLEILQEIKTQ